MSRMEDMVRMHGEVCDKNVAAKILSCSRRSIYNMIADGRICTACEGTMVDVRSICRYIEGGQDHGHV